jgi:amino acid transporter
MLPDPTVHSKALAPLPGLVPSRMTIMANAEENLGIVSGLVAAAALIIDYVLTVAVSVAAGVANIASAIPWLHQHMVLVSVAIVILITVINLRGVQESATIFALPTYFFILSIIIMLIAGAWHLVFGTVPAKAPLVHEVYQAIPLLLLFRAFSSGCTALTGIEAISNSVTIFRPPATRNAKATMTWMVIILATFFVGVTALSHVYGIHPRLGETTISSLSRAVFGDSFLYYIVPISTALVLLLAANTSYTGFPRLCSLIAQDRYMPRQLASLGDRLVFSNGIISLSLGAIFLLVLFNANTHRLIPLYAVGVFLSFTLAQAGMVVHHVRSQHSGWQRAAFFNGLGALTTICVCIVIAVSKFTHGAWVVIILIPAGFFLFMKIHKHYINVSKELAIPATEVITISPIKHTVVIPISGIHRGVVDAIRYALSISNDVRACYVELDPKVTERLKDEWHRLDLNIPFIVLKSQYRSVIGPLLKYIEDVDQTSHNYLTVVIPEFITARWWEQLLHNQTALMIRTALKLQRRKIVTSVRYHLHSPEL